MRALLFAKRCTKEVVRDPINLFFGLVFPLVLLGLLPIINASIPAEANNTMFAIRNLAPGIAMFGTAFLALFSGMLLAKRPNFIIPDASVYLAYDSPRFYHWIHNSDDYHCYHAGSDYPRYRLLYRARLFSAYYWGNRYYNGNVASICWMWVILRQSH